MRKSVKAIAIAIISSAVLSCGSSGGKQSSSKAPLSGIEQYTIAFFAELDEHEDDRNFDQREALDRMKEGFEKHLTAAVGKKIPTSASALVGSIDEPFTVTECSGNVGRSSAVPYAILTAKVQTEAKKLGYICRDKDGLPVWAGKADVADGEISIPLRFSHDGARDWCIASDKTMASISSVDLLSENDFEARVLYCKGASYNFKGFGSIKLFGKASEIAGTLEGVYDKTEVETSVEEGPEEDFEITRLVLSNKGEKVAAVGYDNDEIYAVEVNTPEVFCLPDVYKYDGSIPLHCKSAAALLLQAAGGRGTFTDENYIDIPAIKIGMAWFTGMKLKDDSPRREFYIKDLADDTRAEKVVLRRTY